MTDDILTLEELADLQKLVRLPEWKQFRKIVEKHRIKLQKEVNVCTKQGETRKADRAQAKMEDIDIIFMLTKDRIKDLQEHFKKGGE